MPIIRAIFRKKDDKITVVNIKNRFPKGKVYRGGADFNVFIFSGNSF